MSRIAVPGMQGQNALGGEMPFGGARCTFRNGNGINPTDYRCVTRPVLGTTWTTSYGSNPNTIATAMLFGFAPATGPNLFQGELLVALTPTPVPISGTGNISLPVRNTVSLAGVQLFLLNAQDVTFEN